MITGIVDVQNKEMVDLRINDSMDGLDVAQTLSVNPLDSILDVVNSVASIQNAVQPALDAMENTLANIPELGNTIYKSTKYQLSDLYKYIRNEVNPYG